VRRAATLALIALTAACQLVAPLSPLPPRPDGGDGGAPADAAPPDAASPDAALDAAPDADAGAALDAAVHADAPDADTALDAAVHADALDADAAPPDTASPDAAHADAPDADAPGSDGGGDAGDSGDAGQSRFVVVGTNFTNGWSADGVTWNVVESPAPGMDAKALAYGGGVFVSVGQDVRTSRDGASWDLAIYNARAPFLAVTYSDGYFLASGAYGFRMRSGDGGQTWSDYTELTPEWLYAIAAGNGIAVAVTGNFQGTNGNGGSTSSQDLGRTWTPIAAAPGPLGSIAFGNGVFVAAGSNVVATTTNGTDWTSETVDESDDLFSVVFIDGQFYIVGSQAYWRTSDGVSLTKQSIPLPPVLVKGDGVYVGAQYFRLYEGTRIDVVTNVVYGPTNLLNLTGLAFGRVGP
jgi:hypothetical protein